MHEALPSPNIHVEIWQTMGDKGEHRKADTIQQKETIKGSMGDKGKQDLGKADAPSNIRRHTCGKTMRDKGR